MLPFYAFLGVHWSALFLSKRLWRTRPGEPALRALMFPAVSLPWSRAHNQEGLLECFPQCVAEFAWFAIESSNVKKRDKVRTGCYSLPTQQHQLHMIITQLHANVGFSYSPRTCGKSIKCIGFLGKYSQLCSTGLHPMLPSDKGFG